MIQVWRMKQEKNRGKRKNKDNYVTRIFVFAVSLVLFIAAIGVYIGLTDPDGQSSMAILFFLPVGAVAACLLFVRVNMSRFIIFIKESGMLFRVMFTNNPDVSERDFERKLTELEQRLKKAQEAEDLFEILEDKYAQAMRIINVKLILKRPSAFIIKCQIKYKGKLRRKKMRIINNYENIDTLISEFEKLKYAHGCTDTTINQTL